MKKDIMSIIQDRFNFLDNEIEFDLSTDVDEYKRQRPLMIDVLASLHIEAIPFIDVSCDGFIEVNWIKYKEFKLIKLFLEENGDFRIYKLNRDGSELRAIVKKGFVKDYIY